MAKCLGTHLHDETNRFKRQENDFSLLGTHYRWEGEGLPADKRIFLGVGMQGRATVTPTQGISLHSAGPGLRRPLTPAQLGGSQDSEDTLDPTAPLDEAGGQVGGSLTELSDHQEISPQTFI